MNKPVMGIQLYTLRDFIQTAGDFDGALEKLKKMGVTDVQISGIGDIPAETQSEILKKHSMKVCVTHKGFERMLPLGWGFFLIHWTSRAIIACLNFLEQFNLNYGIIIIIITLLLRLVLLPLVIPSYKSSAVMRILRPEMEALNKKYPNQDQALQKQQEMMRQMQNKK